ncbi:hypothetical protein [Aegicerativicinus sediminis]|nr:hypothetical protein [Aegicerativicinus sediminis]
MEIITSFYDNYKNAMQGLHIAIRILVTAVLIFTLAAVAMAIVNVFITTI